MLCCVCSSGLVSVMAMRGSQAQPWATSHPRMGSSTVSLLLLLEIHNMNTLRPVVTETDLVLMGGRALGSL